MPSFMATLGQSDSQAVCGDADEVVRDVSGRIEAMGGVDVLLVQSDQGALPPAEAADSYGRFAHEVAPRL
jgi:hypothetical protein